MTWHKLQDEHPPTLKELVIKWGKNEFHGTREVTPYEDFIQCYDTKRKKLFEIDLNVPFVNPNIFWKLA